MLEAYKMNSKVSPIKLKKLKKASFDNLQFRIGELARMTEVSTRQLRYWEKQGYVTSIQRDGDKDSRVYGFRAYVKVTMIKQFLDEGQALHDAVSAAEEQIEGVTIVQKIMKKAFQGLDIYDDHNVVNLGFFDEAETQLLYVSMENNKVRYHVVDIESESAKHFQAE